jgi:hypothetical protein
MEKSLFWNKPDVKPQRKFLMQRYQKIPHAKSQSRKGNLKCKNTKRYLRQSRQAARVQ